jgi:MinD-like ATPase involved in chromosome partitioning or flagellar assembly
VLVAFGSAKGAPGVTTTARVLASIWPAEVVLVDADPAGGDLSLLARTVDRGALDPERGLLSLAADARRGLVEGGIGEHLQQIEGGLNVLCGVSYPEQMTGIAPVWPALAGALANVRGADVLVDCGRVVASSPVMPAVLSADVLVLVARPQLESFAHVRERLRWLAHLQDTTARVPAVGVVLVADSRDKRSLADLGQLLAHERLPATVLGQVAFDEKSADVVAGRLERPIARSLLVRSARQLVEPVAALAASRGAVRRPA